MGLFIHKLKKKWKTRKRVTNSISSYKIWSAPLWSLRSTSARKKKEKPNVCYKKLRGGGLQSAVGKKSFPQEAHAPPEATSIPQLPPRNRAADPGSSSHYRTRRLNRLKCIHQCPPPSSSQAITSWDQWVIVREEGMTLEVTRDGEKNNKPLSWLGYDGSYNLRTAFKKNATSASFPYSRLLHATSSTLETLIIIEIHLIETHLIETNWNSTATTIAVN